MKRVLIFILLLNISSLFSQNYYPHKDSSSWETIPPETIGYCSDSVSSLYQFLEDNNTKAFILLKGGKIVLEKYFGTFEQDSLWYWASSGKTLTAFMVGIAQKEGVLSIEDTTSKYLGTGWTNCTSQQEEKITIKEQLKLTSGLDDGVANPDCQDPNCLEFHSAAGSRWAYHNGPYSLLNNVISSATGQTVNGYFFTKLKSKTGIAGSFINVGDNKIFFSTARSMARFGLLLLGKGDWGAQPVLNDTNYFNDMVNSSQTINPSYGYLTWLNGKSEYMLPQSQVVFQGDIFPSAPADAYAALGKNGQLIHVAPSEDLVWVRMGTAPAQGSGLVSLSLSNQIWDRINALECSVANIDELSGNQRAVVVNGANNLYIHSTYAISNVQVFDLNGRKVMEQLVRGEKEPSIKVPSLLTNVFFVKIIYSDGYEEVLKSRL